MKAKTTVAEFEDLKGVNEKGEKLEPLTGKALLELKSFGELEGDFVDSTGHKWKMKAKRVKE